MHRTHTWSQRNRLGGLWRFAVAITLLNLLGHTLLGFEQAWLHPLVALAAAYGTELAIEAAGAWSQRRPPRFLGGARNFTEFLLSAHITGLAVSMLLYSNERYWVLAFAAALAIASKAVLRVPVPTAGPQEPPPQQRHFFNPSNFGIALVLLLFPWVGIAPPYHFTENTSGLVDWLLPLLIVGSGSFLNARFTGRLPVIAGWLTFFVLQALLRAAFSGVSPVAGLLPATGLAFVLFTFYMVTDPATTPSRPRDQFVFGATVAIVYGVLMELHIVFGLFFALAIVTGGRGLRVRPESS